MKMIVASVRTTKFPDLRDELLQSGNASITVYPVHSCQQQLPAMQYGGTSVETNLVSKMRVEIAVNDDHVAGVIDTIRSIASSGIDEEGIIAVYDLDQCICIRTGEQGPEALQ